MIDDRLLVDEVVRRVAALRAHSRRQPLAGEELVHPYARKPGDAQRERRVTARLLVATFMLRLAVGARF